MAPLLEIDSLSAGYGETPVLSGVSLRLERGQAWVVLGPNGAGKSTLVRAVMGLIAPSSGTVKVCGLPVPGTSSRELSKVAAWVPQTMDDATGFTGLEVALMGRAPHLSAWGLPGARDEEAAHGVMKELGVDHLSARPLSEVSGGERRRVWLARALVQVPKLLVLDEPTAFLDIRHQVETLRAVQRRLSAGLGVLAVLHDVNLAMHVATHALLLKDGTCVAQGPVKEVLTAAALSALFEIPMHPAAEAEQVFVPRWEGT
ncbi:MAG: ABC transporter ATP-binding protein [Archangium sp.]|nr:ABC transporter ATP-binding protein [Archangium sp.]MDP3153191.1 ABC transporter ATP-binding protein [Archangium sp.]MDP3570225.1 ABC transporter ATP-binding protein [Archangium sp.]